MNDFSIEYKGGSIYVNGTIVDESKLNAVIRPYLTQINQKIVSIATKAYHSKKDPATIAQEIGRAVGVQTRMNGDSFEVFCNDSQIWKAVDTLTESDCSECKKARLIRELSQNG